MRSVLAVDIGAHTITAALAELEREPDPRPFSPEGRDFYLPHTFVDHERIPQPSTWEGDPAETIHQPSLLLGKPPQILGGAPLSGATLVGISAMPAIEAVTQETGAEPFALVGVHPEWDAKIVADFQRGLDRTLDNVSVVASAAAIAAQTMPPTSRASHVTVFDLGADALRLILVKFSRRGKPTVAHTAAEPKGGLRMLDRTIASRAAGDNTGNKDSAWWAAAELAARDARERSLSSNAGHVQIALPAPVGEVTVAVRRVRSWITEAARPAIAELISAEAVQKAWDSDRTPDSTMPLTEAVGGGAFEPGLISALKAEIGPVTVVDDPHAAAAFGAALLQTPYWYARQSESKEPTKRRRRWFGGRK